MSFIQFSKDSLNTCDVQGIVSVLGTPPRIRQKFSLPALKEWEKQIANQYIKHRSGHVKDSRKQAGVGSIGGGCRLGGLTGQVTVA